MQLNKPCHFLQIWIKPSASGLKPGYSTRNFSDYDKRDKLCLLVGPQGPIQINQDAFTFASILSQGKQLEYNYYNQ